MDMKRNGRIDPLVQTILWLTFNKGSRGDEAVKVEISFSSHSKFFIF